GKLADELTAAGAEVRVAACDVADRAAVAELVAAIPAEHPLTAVVHAAGLADYGPVTSIDPARVRELFAVTVPGAWHLHETTRTTDLAAFVLCSSLASTFGAVGHANQTAANAWLDALAEHRAAEGLPAVSIGWGQWALGEAAGPTTVGPELRRALCD